MQLGNISSAHFSQTIPSKTIEKEIAAEERGRLQTNSFNDINNCCIGPLALARPLDRSAKLVDMSDSEYVSLMDESFEGVPACERLLRCVRLLPLRFDLVAEERLLSDVSSSSEESEGYDIRRFSLKRRNERREKLMMMRLLLTIKD